MNKQKTIKKDLLHFLILMCTVVSMINVWNFFVNAWKLMAIHSPYCYKMFQLHIREQTIKFHRSNYRCQIPNKLEKLENIIIYLLVII